MENKVLQMLLEHNVEFDKEINNVNNINKIKEKTRMQLFFIYSVLADYRNIDTIDIPEVKRVAINKLFILYGNYIKLKLEEKNSELLPFVLINNPGFKSTLENKLVNYLIQATDLLLKGAIDVWTLSNWMEVEKIAASSVDIVIKEMRLKRRK